MRQSDVRLVELSSGRWGDLGGERRCFRGVLTDVDC